MNANPITNAPWLAPPPGWHEQEHHSHTVQFYSEEECLLAGLSRFIGAALAAGDSAIIIATKKHREGIDDLLKTQGMDTGAASPKGRYIALDAAETLAKFMRDGQPDEKAFSDLLSAIVLCAKGASQGGGNRVVAFGEMVDLLRAEGNTEGALRVEQLWNDLARAYTFNLRCGYSMANFDKEEDLEPFLRICSEHTAVIPAESYTSLSTDEERIRNITYLQQRAQALEFETAKRKEAQNALRQRESDLSDAKQELESRVVARTTELTQKNQQTQQQADVLAITNHDLREMSWLLLESQDEERRKVARDLHDSTAQLLVALGMNLSVLKAKAKKGAPQLAGAVSESIVLVDRILEEVRATSHLLHPPILDEIGLYPALQWYADRFTERSNIAVDLQLPEGQERLPIDLETAIFRIAQECLTNVQRHAGSATATIQLWQTANSITLVVEDQGRGISSRDRARISAGGLPGAGLTAAMERVRRFGGDLEITSDEKGTRIKTVIPLNLKKCASNHNGDEAGVRRD
jgi:signal transduction histidine kinase